MMAHAMEAIRDIQTFAAAGYRAGVVEKNSWGRQSELYDAVTRSHSNDKFEIFSPRQTHSAEIILVDQRSSIRNPVADGLMCQSSGICLTVRTADCVPILFADTSIGLCGAVHAGWRGMTSGIIEEMFSLAGKLRSIPENLLVYLGPSIGACCFEVGDEVCALIDDEYVINRSGRNYVDLSNAIRNKVLKFGVNESNVLVSGDCTFCGKERFYSYRRDGDAPIQMVSYIFRSR